MNDFVTSRSAADALVTMIMGQMDRYSESDFRQRMEDNAVGGGTRATVRSACGLPVAIHVPNAPPSEPMFVAETSRQGFPAPGTLFNMPPIVPGPVLEHGVVSVESVEAQQGPAFFLCLGQSISRRHIALTRHCLESGAALCSDCIIRRLPQEVWRTHHKDSRSVMVNLGSRVDWRELPT